MSRMISVAAGCRFTASGVGCPCSSVACAAPANDIAPAAMLAIQAPRFTQFSSLEIQRRYGARRRRRLYSPGAAFDRALRVCKSPTGWGASMSRAWLPRRFSTAILTLAAAAVAAPFADLAMAQRSDPSAVTVVGRDPNARRCSEQVLRGDPATQRSIVAPRRWDTGT